MSLARLGARIARLHPFTTRYASNLAILFGVVYFAQGMRHLPRQSLVIALKDGGLSAVQVATFFSLSPDPMVVFLAFLDLAAKACPPRVEGTFFALLAAVYNGGSQGSEIVGGYLYNILGYVPLVLISAAASALAWVLVPLVRINVIEATARWEADAVIGAFWGCRRAGHQLPFGHSGLLFHTSRGAPSDRHDGRD